MAKDSYSAVWVSHTSISDFLTCPRAYYLKNVYRDPKTRHKIKLMSPPLALGQAVHEVLESLSILPSEDRFKESLVVRFHEVWKKVTGKKGGFTHEETEELYKRRGEKMLERVMKSPGPLVNKAVKIKMDLPKYWLSEKDNIILCGKIDWLEYFETTDTVHIIDFKTSKNEEEGSSLQLPIYFLLVTNCQTKRISKMSYWYIERDDGLVERPLPDLSSSEEKLLDIAKKIKTARQLNVFKCPQKNGCYACRPFEAILHGEAEYVGLGSFKEDVYLLDKSLMNSSKESTIL